MKSVTQIVRRTTYPGSNWMLIVERAMNMNHTGQIILHTSQGGVSAVELVEYQTLPVEKSLDMPTGSVVVVRT